MCGIVGVITKADNGLTYPQQDLFEEMLVCDAIRGTDSTGLFGVTKAGNAEFVKLASHPFNLLKTTEYRDWKTKSWSNGKVVIGHNRKATQGAVNNENAHPFAHGPILLVHNGSIENFRSLLDHRVRDKYKVEVDSHAIAVLFAKDNPVDVIPELRGAFVLVWYNATERRINFIRNSERPLSMVETSDGSYYASEKGMLRWLLRRRGNNSDIAELKPGALVSIGLDGKSEVREIKVYEKPPIQVAAGSTQHRHHHSTTTGYTPTTRSAYIDRHEPITVDQNGVVYINNKESRTVPSKINMEEKDSFNIHYGRDEEVVLADTVWPQIVFTVDDYKKISEDHVEPPVWKLWGQALDSKRTIVYCQFRGQEEEVDKLAYSTHLAAHITRIGDRKFDGVNGQFVATTVPRPVEIEVTPNGLPIVKEHLEYIKHKQKCACNAVDVDTVDKDDVMYVRKGFETLAMCKWCVEGTPECARFCGPDNVGKCEYCTKAGEYRQTAKDITDAPAPNPAVQAVQPVSKDDSSGS